MNTKVGSIELFGGDYEHVLGLSQTRNGIDITYTIRPLLEIFERMLAEQAYEACEFSLSNYIMLKDRGADWLFAVPVFPYRAFRHSTLFVRRDSSLREPSQLRGKRVGIPDYSMTAAVWTRGILGEQYGVHWSEMRWTASGRQRFAAFEGIKIDFVQEDLEQALIEGRIDTLLTPHTEDELKPAEQRQLRRLIADAQAAEEAYVDQTGVYPINHVIVLRKDALARLANLPRAVFDAYAACKAAAYKRRLGTTLMPWGARHWTKVFDKFGGNPLPYGLTELNREVVAKLAGFLHDQKLIKTVPDVDALFISESRDFEE
ncbi:MAG: PhnD/SsuA/transferrin family substrate-binding protein [Alphaproteobacteria bacterium]|nr:PhnD/SsuA/transferrin family substrate-binding protein [Alphaproteobacteria bacterium]